MRASNSDIFSSNKSYKTDILLCGFVRRIQSSESSLCLPEDILQLMASFITFIDEWDEETARQIDIICKQTEQSDRTISAKRSESSNGKWYHVFGKDICSIGQVKHWKIRLMNIRFQNVAMLIGVVDIKMIKLLNIPPFDCYFASLPGGYGLNTIERALISGNHSG
eukprot:186979_1